MKCTHEYQDEHYGTGLQNFGPKQWFAELTEDDEPEIKDQIRQWIEENWELPPEEMSVYLYCKQADEEFEIEINPYEHMNEDHMREILAELEEV